MKKRLIAVLMVGCLLLWSGQTPVSSQSRISPAQLPGMGVTVDNVTGSTYAIACGDITANSDNSHWKNFSNATTSTAVSIFEAGTCAWAPNFVVAIGVPVGAVTVTITPTTSTIGIYGQSQASTMTITAGQTFVLYTDVTTTSCVSNGCYVAVQTNGGGSGGNAFAALTDGATVTWAMAGRPSANATLTFTAHSGSRTLNITNPTNGGNYVLQIIQDGTGGEGLTLGSGCTWKVGGGGSGAITPSTGAGARDILAFTYDGTNCYLNFNKNFN